MLEHRQNLKEQYKEWIKSFLVENNIKEVICKDMKEHFFDRVVVVDKANRVISVDKYGYKNFTDNLYFDFTCDYAQCLANMEHNLYMQTREGKHDKYDFIFDEDYSAPILVEC